MYTLFVPPRPPTLVSYTFPTFGQKLFHPPVLWFCRRKTIKDNKKNMAFLLVCNKDSYIGRFFVLFPCCICVLQPNLHHLYQTSSLLLNPIPIVALASLRLLYSFLYSDHINHIQDFALPLLCVVSPSVICVCSICFRSITLIW
jgi:hypothetical protein